MPIYRPQTADRMTSFVRGLNPEGIARAYNYGAYNRGMAERDQAELEQKERRRQEDRSHKTANDMANIMGNENLPPKLRYESYENYTAMMNSLVPGTYPGRIMSQEEFFSKPGQGVIKDLAKKQKNLNDQFLKGKLLDPSGKVVTDRSKAARLINIYMNQNLLDAMSGEEGQYIDQKEVDYIRGMAAVQPQKPMNIGGELYQPGTGKFMPQVPPEPKPPKEKSAVEKEKERILNIPAANRTPEEKKLLGSYIAPEKQKSQGEINMFNLKIKKLEKDLKGKPPGTKDIVTYSDLLKQKYSGMLNDDEEGFWKEYSDYIIKHPEIDADMALLIGASDAGIGEAAPEDIVYKINSARGRSGKSSGTMTSQQTGPVGNGFPSSITWEKVRENAKKRNMTVDAYLNQLSSDLGISR